MTPSSLFGTWIPEQQEIAGQVLPPAAFAGQRLTLEPDRYTMQAESQDSGTLAFSAPDRIDIEGTEGPNNGKHFKAIYRLDGDRLTICYDLSGTAYPESFRSSGGPLHFLSTFRREG